MVEAIALAKILSKIEAQLLVKKKKQQLLLRFFKNKSIKEMDEMTGLKNTAVYILRAIDKLKTLVGADTFYTYFDDFIIED